MSTTIYNGFEVPLMSFPELLAFCHKFQQIAQKHKELLIFDYLSNQLIIPRDMALLPQYFKEEKILSYSEACSEIEDRVFKDRSGSDTFVNYTCETIFIPVENKILALFYGSQFSRVWETFPGVTDFHYQDQTDIPEDIDPKAYEERGRLWEIAVGDDAPANRGFSYQFTDKSPSMTLYLEGVKKFLDHQPSKSQRIKTLTNLVIRSLLKKAGRSENEVEEFMEQEQELVARIHEELKAVLPESYEKSSLINKI